MHRELSIMDALPELIVLRRCWFRWEQRVYCRVWWGLFKALRKRRSSASSISSTMSGRWAVVTALTSLYERIDSLEIGAGYEAPPRRRRVRQPRHHDCPKDSLQACVIHAMVAEDTQSIQHLFPLKQKRRCSNISGRLHQSLIITITFVNTSHCIGLHG